jgi:hypothetical protein
VRRHCCAALIMQLLMRSPFIANPEP